MVCQKGTLKLRTKSRAFGSAEELRIASGRGEARGFQPWDH